MPVMQVWRASSQKPAPCFTASASLVHLQVAAQLPLLASHTEPCVQSVFALQPAAGGASGSHDERATSQWKPSPQSVSPPQKPASVHVPSSAQKQPAEHCVLSLHPNPGPPGMLVPELPLELPPELLSE